MIKIGSWSGEHNFIISRSLGDKEIILGRDILKSFSVQIDHGFDKITIRDEKKNCSFELNSFETICCLVESVPVPPCSEKVVKCHTSSDLYGEDVLFSPSFISDSIYLSNCVTKVDKNGDVFISLINLREKDVFLHEKQILGSVTSRFEIVPDSLSIELKLTSTSSNKPQSNSIIFDPTIEEKL